VTVVTLPAAQSVFEVGGELGSDWLLVIALSLVPVTIIEVVKGLVSRSPRG
jgi:hypothetical protein